MVMMGSIFSMWGWNSFGKTARPRRAAAQPVRRAPMPYWIVTVALAAALPAAAEPPRLGLPLACEPGRTCFVQHYVDVAPGISPQDFRCGHSTYQGHSGTDFRVLSAAAARQGIAVLAAAGGIVKGRRDGMADGFPRETGRDAIAGRECGNGIVIDHGDGWETQYCHMRQGSVRVETGQEVERGTALGEVGYSGLADSAHLHLTVRHQTRVIDPFTGRSPDGTCQRTPGETRALFDDNVIQAFPYTDGDFLQTGFAGRTVTWAELELDHTVGAPISPASDALIFFARMTHLRSGDRVRLIVSGPGGFALDVPGTSVDRDKAIYIAHAGKKRTHKRWPSGLYSGEARLIRDGAEIRMSRQTISMPE